MLTDFFAAYLLDELRREPPTPEEMQFFRTCSGRNARELLMSKKPHARVISFRNFVTEEVAFWGGEVDSERYPTVSYKLQQLRAGVLASRAERRLSEEAAAFLAAHEIAVQRVMIPYKNMLPPAPATIRVVARELLGGIRLLKAGKLTDRSWRGELDAMFAE